MKRRILKVLITILAVLQSVLLLTVLVTAVINMVKSSHELRVLHELGYYNPVNTGDHCLNVAGFGNRSGKHTIVALSGLGLGDYSVTWRKMTSYLESDDQIVFIDRAGYGLSDDTDDVMTLDYIVEDYRKALQNGGFAAPYILMAHSIGGAYITYWESKYPEEVEAVVFVDGSQLSADAFEGLDKGEVTFRDRLSALLAKTGFGRYVIRDHYPEYGSNYNEEDQWLGDALMLRTMDSVAPLSEKYNTADNASRAFREIRTNDIPKLYICASWGYDSEIYQRARDLELKPYLDRLGNCRLELLPGDHMIYEQQPDECGRIIRDFIRNLP